MTEDGQQTRDSMPDAAGEQTPQEARSRAPEGGDVAKSDLLQAYRRKKSEPSDEREEQERARSKRQTEKQTSDGESIVVDFVANFVAGGNASFEPVKGRVLMSQRRLILATSKAKTVIPITSIFDIAVGQVPPEVEEFFDYTVMVGYIIGRQRRTTVIGGDRDTIEKFSLLLFRAALNGSRAQVTHPARIGGRVLDTERQPSGLHLDYEAVTFPDDDGPLTENGDPFHIDLASVIFFEVLERTVDGETRLVLSVQHVKQGQTVTSEITLDSRRKMNILGRYLRLVYHWIKSGVRNVEVTEQGLEVLVGLYSAGEMAAEVDFSELLGVEEEVLDAELEKLHEEELIGDDELPTSLTPQGRFVVNEEIEDVNV
ncbi:chemotaxis protein CheF [Haloferax sp. Atlit-10N]|uniref:Chemotaxis protein CheF2 n=1 Tax=Haloferax prahovense (strain DSM 18310 / JCM 13924 / TL6) TaxID=1227461 RepID=M0GLC8_HALPT|nr:chemotaxis protein CheF2 [Haloferax prahovense DSM 18310]RDZ45772.1 chemotaxis protein CheF [Haloferax sp. Atlit-19N]RDZ46955.1 chemotaxis protein CheF [Haloferax sp. Atlit-16N]RDZ60787.1 chemotaxis protein CheF [Haloferax sp. Atlit-10N]